MIQAAWRRCHRGDVRSRGPEPATDMLDFFNEIGVPMKCCTDPMRVDQMPGPERVAAALKKHKMEGLEAPGDQQSTPTMQCTYLVATFD
jgi:hypothetical protein